MLAMKTFGRKHRLQADSLQDVKDGFDEAVLRLRKRIRFRGNTLQGGHFLNALALWFIELPEVKREEIGREAVIRLETVMAEDSAESLPAEGASHVVSPAEMETIRAKAAPVKPGPKGKSRRRPV